MKQLNELVVDFQEKVNHTSDQMDLEKLFLRHSLAEEETDELLTAVTEQNPEDIVDALIDQVYIALGTLELLEVDVRKAFLEVHSCNMQKERGLNTSRTYSLSGGREFDVVKPKGWVGPDHSDNIGILTNILKGKD